ncbi:MAG TPA: hypothetical protein PLR02_07285 [Rhodocyclaceae bacterium]|nr:hypothetical protein [Rhodocyclaceae bacterium]
MKNPFVRYDMFHGWVEATSVADRLEMVRRFDVPECEAALGVEGLQESVAIALHKTMRLKRECEEEFTRYLMRGKSDQGGAQ